MMSQYYRFIFKFRVKKESMTNLGICGMRFGPSKLNRKTTFVNFDLGPKQSTREIKEEVVFECCYFWLTRQAKG